ncbi:MAG TPA: hypothetical protein VKR56_03220 [Candidatus Cybelea sp.]|jgi:hypothetical protein|nr:hypothetical protein [Candidatus Cybelea sp.]
MRLNAGVPLAVSLAMIGALVGCNGLRQSAASGFHSGFRSSFKTNFIKSCTAQPGATETLCGCVEAALERGHTDDQLIKMTSGGPETSKELVDDARACAATTAKPALDPAHIDAYVTPYYSSQGPAIRVGPFSSGLASRNPKRFLATIGAMKKQWQRLSFPELYVGAIRLYDLGYRNDAVYWFYTAQYRARLVSVLLDPAKIGQMGDPGFELQAAGNAFMQTVGTWINGYAFGNPNRLIATVRRVQREGRRIGDLRAIYPDVAFVSPGRWPPANRRLADGMDSLVTYLEQQKNVIARQRAANGTDAKFSHLTSK